MFKTVTPVCKFLYTCFPRYFAPYLSSYSSSYSTRHSQIGGNLLVIPKFYPSVHKSVKQFGNSFAFDAPTVWNARVPTSLKFLENPWKKLLHFQGLERPWIWPKLNKILEFVIAQLLHLHHLVLRLWQTQQSKYDLVVVCVKILLDVLTSIVVMSLSNVKIVWQ